MKRIPVYRGEFGLRIYYHVPQVHTICQREPCLVEIEEGMEALYPAAAEWRIVDGPADHNERGGKGRPRDLGVEPTRFVPEPWERPTWNGPAPREDGWDYDLGADGVVVCPRKLEYGAAKNWEGWFALHAELVMDGHVVCSAGAPGSSYELPQSFSTWRHHRFLDATIQAMRSARLVIATDAGLAHLAVLCGAPLLLVTYRGLVAPGPVIDSSGRKARDSYWRAGYDPAERVNRFEDANHTGAPIVYVDGWEDPSRVVKAANQMMEVLA